MAWAMSPDELEQVFAIVEKPALQLQVCLKPPQAIMAAHDQLESQVCLCDAFSVFSRARRCCDHEFRVHVCV